MMLQTILVIAATLAAGGVAWELGSRLSGQRRQYPH